MRKKYVSLCILTMLLLWWDVDDGWATGPSVAHIRIIPLTYTDYGIILCKTRYEINATGDHALNKIEYGWLIVSATGIWEEHSHLIFDPDQFQHGDQAMINEVARLEEEFQALLNWDTPPKSVQPLLQKYGFQQRDMNFTHHKEAMLPVHATLNACNECVKQQRSLHNLTALIPEDNRHLDIIFFYAGVVFLQNIYTESEERGVMFAIPNFRNLGDGIIRDYGIEEQVIDGIVILPR